MEPQLFFLYILSKILNSSNNSNILIYLKNCIRYFKSSQISETGVLNRFYLHIFIIKWEGIKNFQIFLRNPFNSFAEPLGLDFENRCSTEPWKKFLLLPPPLSSNGLTSTPCAPPPSSQSTSASSLFSSEKKLNRQANFN